MMLAIDCGNSRIKWGVVCDGHPYEFGHAPLRPSVDQALEQLGTVLAPGIERVIVANVAGDEVGAGIARVVVDELGFEPELVAVQAEAFGIRCAYDEPSELGVDRWVAMIAARRAASGLVGVVNAGTAVTFDAVDAAGVHLGGLILPGARLMTGALAARTSRIELSSLPDEAASGLAALGTSTGAAVGHGAWLAVAGAIDRAVRIVADAFGAAPRLVLGGGDAKALAGWLESEAAVQPDLVLEGLAVIANEQGNLSA